MYVEQKLDNDFEDTIYAPLDQFGNSGDGYKDNVTVMCHVIGNPWPDAGSIQIQHDNPNPSTDDISKFQNCKGLKSQANIAYCSYTSYWTYARYPNWRCAATQSLDDGTKKDAQKKFKVVQVPGKIKVRMHYYKWYNYTQKDLVFNFILGGIATIKCEARYQDSDGAPLTELPFKYKYEYFLNGFEGIPHYARQAGDTLYLEDIPESLSGGEIICFVTPTDSTEIKKYGIGQRYFKANVYTTPERPDVLVTMKDVDDPSLTLRNPEFVTNDIGSADTTDLRCSLQNFQEKLDAKNGQKNPQWLKCKNKKCLINEATAGELVTRDEGQSVSILTASAKQYKATGIYMCAAVRTFVNVTGNADSVSNAKVVKIFAESKPGAGERKNTVYGTLNITKSSNGDIQYICTMMGYPYPELELVRYNKDNRKVTQDAPKWIREEYSTYFDKNQSNIYGSQLAFRYPRENQVGDSGEGFYICYGNNDFGDAQLEQLFEA